MNDRNNDPARIVATVRRYYTDRLRQFGATPRGVDWNSADSQALRFSRLLELLPVPRDGDPPASLLDYGCGYGALADYLAERGRVLNYRGYDASAEMIAAAEARHGSGSGRSYTAAADALHPAEFVVASGIFNVKLDFPETAWRPYVWDTIATLNRLSRRAFAFNMLSTCSDADKRRDDLFYMDPGEALNGCLQRFPRQVTLLHDYPLYEFTIIVKK
jgi:SAM-dependent methyltransferase